MDYPERDFGISEISFHAFSAYAFSSQLFDKLFGFVRLTPVTSATLLVMSCPLIIHGYFLKFYAVACRNRLKSRRRLSHFIFNTTNVISSFCGLPFAQRSPTLTKYSIISRGWREAASASDCLALE